MGVDRHLGFSTSVSSQYGIDTCPIGMAHPRKHSYNRWNRVAIKCGNRDNRFAVSTSGLGRHLEFYTSVHSKKRSGEYD